MPDTVTEYISGIPMEQRPWYEDRNTVAELYEFMTLRGEQPLNVSHFIRYAYDWEPQYSEMVGRKGREVMLEQAKACRDARMGTVAPKDDQGATDGQHAA